VAIPAILAHNFLRTRIGRFWRECSVPKVWLRTRHRPTGGHFDLPRRCH
jgi:hypothetical protein